MPQDKPQPEQPRKTPGRQRVPRNAEGLTAEQEARREHILQSAIDVYCHYGFYGATLSKIAEAEGCTKALVIVYYHTMEELATAATDRILGGIVAELRRVWEQECAGYVQQVEQVFRYFQGARREVRFLIGLMTVPALEQYVRGINAAMLGKGDAAIARYGGDVAPGLTFDLAYIMTAHYFCYIVGGSERNYRNARDAFLPAFLRDPASYEPFRSAATPEPVLQSGDTPEMRTTGRKKKPPLRDTRREEIIQAALKVFGRYGYYGATVEQIAMAAGVSRSLVFARCGSMEETAKLCAERFLENWFRRLRHIHKKHPCYLDQSDHILELMRFTRDEWRFVVGMLATPSLEETARAICGSHFAALIPLLRESCKGLMPEENIPAFGYSITALYIAYILGGNEENLLRARRQVYRAYFGRAV